ncbi:DNA-directed RNA polymerase [Candidatus Micrarchaeota archaeon]|nr:DNA-directed RNA polymerase [Candidatus Micrarchaeota archaeon]
MYNVVTIRDTIRIPPKLFTESIEESVKKALREQYEGRLDKDMGVIITVTNPREIGDGKIIPGDGAAYHTVMFDALTFKPEVHEVLKGKISEITDFGAFIRFGPIDGLVHVSQVTDDFMSYNEKTQCLVGKDSKKTLKKEDVVTARVIAVSMKGTVSESKINLTMRQEGLGKKEWMKKKGEKTEKPVKKSKKEKK